MVMVVGTITDLDYHRYSPASFTNRFNSRIGKKVMSWILFFQILGIIFFAAVCALALIKEYNKL
jgi:hypothetical protein